MTGGDFFSYIKTWLSNLFTCLKDFNNNSLEEVFVPLADDAPIVVKNTNDFKAIVPDVDENVDDKIDDLPDLIPIEQLPSVDDEEYGFEQELEDTDNSSNDDDDDNQYYYRD
jgi:hypothetical protein